LANFLGPGSGSGSASAFPIQIRIQESQIFFYVTGMVPVV
jgi:hypothetical protein